MTEIVVSSKDEDSLIKLKSYYDNVFVHAFPNQDEINTFEEMEDFIRNKSDNITYGKINLYEHNNNIVAGVIYDYFDDIRSIAIEFIAIDPNYRKSGIASQIFNKVIDEYLENDLIDYVFIEIEDPLKRGDNDDMSYLHFWSKHNFKKIVFNYIQPAISNKRHVESLILCVKQIKENKDIINKDIIKKFIYDYTKCAVGVVGPENNEDVKEMENDLNSRNDNLDLIDLNIYRKAMI
jgi:ribosomal protein S18 acetylase RimI-like enzyme